MNRLAIETATDFCSVALESDGQVQVREQHAPRRHAELLIPWIRELLAGAGLGFSALDALAVSHGPGGFTSLRIGLSVVQGLALAHDLSVHPVSTLKVLARTADPGVVESRVLAVIDARMGEVYAGWFQAQGDSHRALIRERVQAPESLVPPDDGPWLVAGSGLASYRWAIESALGNRIGAGLSQLWPDARAVLAVAADVSPVPAWRLEPNYLRDQVADDSASASSRKNK